MDGLRRLRLALVFVLALPALGAGQSVPLDRWTPALPVGGRQAADIASWATVATIVAFDTKASWDADDRSRALLMQGARAGVTYGVAFAVKRLVHRARPCAPACGIDDPFSSFYSAHTALAWQGLGGPRLSVLVPLAVSTGGLRVLAGKHWLTDTLVGTGAGILTSRIR